MKPVELVERAIRNSSKTRDTILDPFTGREAKLESDGKSYCSSEIAATEALLLAGHPDVEGLCMALVDWSAELRILERDGLIATYVSLQNRALLAEDRKELAELETEATGITESRASASAWHSRATPPDHPPAPPD